MMKLKPQIRELTVPARPAEMAVMPEVIPHEARKVARYTRSTMAICTESLSMESETGISSSAWKKSTAGFSLRLRARSPIFPFFERMFRMMTPTMQATR